MFSQSFYRASTSVPLLIAFFYRYFLTKIDDNLHPSPVDAVRFSVENRFVDNASHCVRYDESEELVFSVTVPLPPGTVVNSLLYSLKNG